jgi:MarR family transcriptional regulator, organic hydroperoxide resistance regulator
MNIAEQNLERVEQAMDAMRRAMAGARERFSEGLQLTRTQLEILLMLVESPQTTSDLAPRLFLTQSAVTQTIDTLVRRGLVERYPDADDRRIVRLKLSASGEELTAHIRSLRRTYMQNLVTRLTATEIEALISINEKLTVLFDESKSKSKEN